MSLTNINSDNQKVREFIKKYVKFCQMNSTVEYCGWIPTNSTRIFFEFIGDETNINQNHEFLIKNMNSKKLLYININPEVSDYISLDLKNLFHYMPGQDHPVSIVKMEMDATNTVYDGQVLVMFFHPERYKKFCQKLNEKFLKYQNKRWKIIYQENDFNLRDTLNQETINSIEEIYGFIKDNIFLSEMEINEKYIEKTLDFFINNHATRTIEASFKLKHNGRIILESITSYNLCIDPPDKWSQEEDIIYDELNSSFLLYSLQDELKKELMLNFDALLLYTAVKRLTHTDTHHDSKLDTYIPVGKRGDWSPERVMYSMLHKIKEIEVTIKRLKKEPELGYIAKVGGVIAYMRSFVLIYEKEEKRCVDCTRILEAANNISMSINSLRPRVEEYRTCIEILKNSLFYIIGLTIGLAVIVFNLVKNELTSSRKDASMPIEAYFQIMGSIFVTFAIFSLVSIYFRPCMYKKAIQFIGEERFYIYRYSHKRKWVLFLMLFILIVFLFYLAYSFYQSALGH